MPQENVGLVYRIFDAFNRRDLDAVLALMDDDVEFGSRLAGIEGGFHGHRGIRRWWEIIRDASPDRIIEVVDAQALGDVTLTLARGRGHGAVSQIPYEETVWSVARWRGKKAIWWGVFPTRAEALEAVGLEEQPMSQDNAEVVRRGLDAFNDADSEALAALSDDDLEISPATETGVEGGEHAYRGKDAWASYFAHAHEVWDDWRIEAAEVFEADDDWVVAVFRVIARGAGSGAPVERSRGIAYKLRGGKISQVRGYLDPREALEAVGLQKPR
jgi:ketosteroid isomerase-like protein